MTGLGVGKNALPGSESGLKNAQGPALLGAGKPQEAAGERRNGPQPQWNRVLTIL